MAPCHQGMARLNFGLVALNLPSHPQDSMWLQLAALNFPVSLPPHLTFPLCRMIKSPMDQIMKNITSWGYPSMQVWNGMTVLFLRTIVWIVALTNLIVIPASALSDPSPNSLTTQVTAALARLQTQSASELSAAEPCGFYLITQAR